MPELAKWDTFYMIVGSAAGALIGLQFVVMTLIAQKPPAQISDLGFAFSTPTVIYFATTLLLGALVRAPWETILPVGILCSILGVCGVIYATIITRRVRKQTIYRPEFEDWLCHAVLPLTGYILLTASAVSTLWHPHEALFGVALAALLFLFVGIHNAWDAVTYHVFVLSPKKARERKDDAT